MHRYYVNKNAQPTGEHEVHQASCGWMPREENCISLGLHENCHSAVRKAKEYYSNVDGCYYCCNECHSK